VQNLVDRYCPVVPGALEHLRFSARLQSPSDAALVHPASRAIDVIERHDQAADPPGESAQDELGATPNEVQVVGLCNGRSSSNIDSHACFLSEGSGFLV
jgi:hypothetical protein